MKSRTATLHFLQMLLTLLQGKTSLSDALKILSGEGIDPQSRYCACSLFSMMKKGKGFTESLQSINSVIFLPPVYFALIRAAELTGNMETVLEQIINDLNRKIQLKEKVINILIYPVLIVFVAIAGTVLIITKGLPLLNTGGMIPAGFLNDAAYGIVAAGVTLLCGGFLLFIIYYRIFSSDSPEFRIFYIMNFLLQGNFTFQDALSHCIPGIKNIRYAGMLIELKNDIAAGVPFAAAVTKTRIFKPFISGWLSVANEEANLKQICTNIVQFYGAKDERIREMAARFLEPLVIILTGSYLLIIMIRVILPILTLSGGIL
ncbi:MAG: type II secretion system F family protein [Treponema sp.]|nr:type II secretion system F family protein [Treponema sp.]